ncbi:MAG: NTF2 enzyme family protein, partial [Caulobacteraceae bacterium]
MSLEQITQAQLDAYNAQDLDAYCGFFTDDVVVADVGGAVNLEGVAAYRERYAGAFAKFPNNKAELLN